MEARNMLLLFTCLWTHKLQVFLRRTSAAITVTFSLVSIISINLRKGMCECGCCLKHWIWMWIISPPSFFRLSLDLCLLRDLWFPVFLGVYCLIHCWKSYFFLTQNLIHPRLGCPARVCHVLDFIPYFSLKIKCEFILAHPRKIEKNCCVLASLNKVNDMRTFHDLSSRS